MTDKTQRIVAGLIALGLFVGGAVLFVTALLQSEPSVNSLVAGGALVAIALSVAYWAIAERTTKPEPIKLNAGAVDKEEPAEHVRGYRPPTSHLPQREAGKPRSASASPMSRFLLAILLGGVGGFLLSDGLEPSGLGNDGDPFSIIIGAVLLIASQYQLIAAGVSRGILDTRE